MKRVIVFLTSLLLVLPAGFTTSAAALTPDDLDATKVLEAVRTTEKRMSTGPAGGEEVDEPPATSVKVPTGPTEEATLAGPKGAIGISLPFAETSRLDETVDGTPVFDNSNGSSTVPVVKEDGSLQINTVLENSQAPKEYSYRLNIPEGAEISEIDGSVLVMLDGNLVGGLSPAWAKDSNGNDVPTHYKVVGGNEVVQVVEHDSSFTYPIVADPWLGAMLFHDFSTNRKGAVGGKPVYSAALTVWGWHVYLGVAPPFSPGAPNPGIGNRIIRTVGWQEWKSKLVGSNPHPTLEQQYACHVLAGYDAWHAGLHWDLELSRPSKPDWKSDIFSHKCNW